MSLIRANRGFTLIEVAVVVLVITLLIGSLLVPLASQVEQRKVSDTQKALDEVREALIGFAMSNGRLPCPDNNGDGLEDPAPGPTLQATVVLVASTPARCRGQR